MSGKVRVSLCVITKNEELFIRQCLRSVAHLVQETILVDTGSTDATVAIAEEEGAKVFAFEWNGDFAAARNYALDKATGDWILVLDADEALEFVSTDEFYGLIATPGVEGYYLKIRNFLGTGNDTVEDHVVRLFRRNKKYRFTGAIHEQVAASIQAANDSGGLAFARLIIVHYGYLDCQIKTKDKHSRNIGVIKQALATAPYDPLLLYSLGIEYLQDGRYLLAVDNLAGALHHLRGDEGYCRDAVMAYGISLYKAGQMQKLVELADKYLKVLPDDGDFYILKGIGTLSDRRYSECIEALAAAIAKGGDLLPVNWLHMLLGDAYNFAGDYARAGEQYFRALQLNPNLPYPLFQLLGLKQREQLCIDWLAVSRLELPAELPPAAFTGPEGSEAAARLTLLLLKILDRCCREQYERLPEIYDECAKILSEWHDKDAPALVREYLRLCLAEAQEYTEAAARIGCGLFQPQPAMQELITASLETAVAVLCPAWAPDPDACLKGI